MIDATIHGILLAFGLILPLGAQNVFIFNQGATQKKLSHALPAVIAASLCDGILILLAVLGVSVMVMTFPWLQIGLFSIGIMFLIYMGWSIWNTTTQVNEDQAKPLSMKNKFGLRCRCLF